MFGCLWVLGVYVDVVWNVSGLSMFGGVPTPIDHPSTKYVPFLPPIKKMCDVPALPVYIFLCGVPPLSQFNSVPLQHAALFWIRVRTSNKCSVPPPSVRVSLYVIPPSSFRGTYPH